MNFRITGKPEEIQRLEAIFLRAGFTPKVYTESRNPKYKSSPNIRLYLNIKPEALEGFFGWLEIVSPPEEE